MTNARRVQQIRARARIRRWRFRQRHLSSGAWDRFRFQNFCHPQIQLLKIFYTD